MRKSEPDPKYFGESLESEAFTYSTQNHISILGCTTQKNTPQPFPSGVCCTPGTPHFWDVPHRFLGFSGWGVAQSATPHFWGVAARFLSDILVLKNFEPGKFPSESRSAWNKLQHLKMFHPETSYVSQWLKAFRFIVETKSKK